MPTEIIVQNSPAVIEIGQGGATTGGNVTVTDASNRYGLGTPITVQQLSDKLAAVLALASGLINTLTAINYKGTRVSAGNVTGAYDWDMEDGNILELTLTGDTEISFNGNNISDTPVIVATQDGTGGHALTFAASEAVVNTDNVTTEAGSITIYSLVKVTAGGKYAGVGFTDTNYTA